MAKPKIILKEDIKEKKRIVMDVMQQGKAQEGLVRDGMTVDEFKKLVREKYGNDVEIINLISKNHEWMDDGRSTVVREDPRYSLKEIHEAMRNDNARKSGLPKV